MNLANRITLSRIMLIPAFLLFAVPVPEWILKIIPAAGAINVYGRYIAAIIFAIAAGTDKVDGYIARSRNQITTLGKFLDPIADKLLIAAALIALVEHNEVSTWVAMIIISRELIVTGFRLVAAGEGEIIAAGKLGKLKMVTQVIAVVVTMLDNFPFNMFTDFPVDNLLMTIALVITVYSGFDYIAKNSKVLKSK